MTKTKYNTEHYHRFGKLYICPVCCTFVATCPSNIDSHYFGARDKYGKRQLGFGCLAKREKTMKTCPRLRELIHSHEEFKALQIVNTSLQKENADLKKSLRSRPKLDKVKDVLFKLYNQL